MHKWATIVVILVMLGGCSASGPVFVPSSLDGTSITDLVPIYGPEQGKLTHIDGIAVKRKGPFFVEPGEHVLAVAVQYVSRNWCSGPLAGKPATAAYTQASGQGASRTSLLVGGYEIGIVAEYGTAVRLQYTPEPDCKDRIEDYYAVVVTSAN
jgi:hypothetical protein